MSVMPLTKMICGIVILLLVIYDIAVFLMYDNSTISVMFTDMAYKNPMIPLLVGMLVGHWFWPAQGSGS